jgi:hypothetical protein
VGTPIREVMDTFLFTGKLPRPSLSPELEVVPSINGGGRNRNRSHLHELPPMA